MNRLDWWVWESTQGTRQIIQFGTSGLMSTFKCYSTSKALEGTCYDTFTMTEFLFITCVTFRFGSGHLVH
jgi:hypothetical protein